LSLYVRSAGRKDGIDHQPERAVEHVRNYFLHYGVHVSVETGI
jgi:hypothetical protein